MVVDRTAVPWTTTDPTFRALGWRPDGNVRCAYQAAPSDTATYSRAYCDIDGDSFYSYRAKIWLRNGPNDDFAYWVACEGGGPPLGSCH